MTVDLLKQIGAFFVLCIAQALVLNHIHLLECATPLLYIYMVLTFRRNYPRWAVLIWSFALGLAVDTFSNTPGVAAASLTFIGLIQPYIFELFIQRDAADDLKPTVVTLGYSKYCYYALILVLVYCTIFFTLETFNFFNWLQWVKSIFGSTVITVVLILTIESVRKK